LDFSAEVNRNFSSLSPNLNQRFFIGDGAVRDGSSNTIFLQEFIVPSGANRLYFGTMDSADGSWKKSGHFTTEVSAVPLPSTVLLLATGLAAFVGAGRLRGIWGQGDWGLTVSSQGHTRVTI